MYVVRMGLIDLHLSNSNSMIWTTEMATISKLFENIVKTLVETTGE